MTHRSLVDIEEFALSIRMDGAKRIFDESVRCYKTGAYGSAISTAWRAVLEDGIHKCRINLESGDEAASQLVKDFDRSIELLRTDEAKAREVSAQVEKKLLNVLCGNLRIISGNDLQDLERIRRDRNRCEHLSKHDAESPFEPSAELARLHMRNAIEMLLSRPPLRGQAAADFTLARLRDGGFPANPELARLEISGASLDNVDESAIVIVLEELLLDTITEEPPRRLLMQRVAAIEAIRDHYGVNFAGLISRAADTVSIGGSTVGTSLLLKLIRAIPWIWEYLHPNVRKSLKSAVSSLDVEIAGNTDLWILAVEIEPLTPIALKHSSHLAINDLAPYARRSRSSTLLQIHLEHLAASTSFADSRKILRSIAQFDKETWTAELTLLFRKAIQDNDQVAKATGLSGVIAGAMEVTNSYIWEPYKEWKETLTSLGSSADDMSEPLGIIEIWDW